MRSIYNLGVRFYGFCIFVASFFNDKANKWRVGRKDIFKKLKDAFKDSPAPIAWFHCASMGEFEQGRPVIEAFKTKFPSYKILLTFFSPSGYEVQKNYKEADYVFYLPLDTPNGAKQFIKIVNPTIAIFVKYEFWHNYLNALKNKGIPTFLISAKFREDQYFFKSMGIWFRESLRFYNKLFVQDENSKVLLKKFGINNVIACGDTRFDRVIYIMEQPYSNTVIEQFKNNELLWICGSTWKEDEKIIFPIFKKLLATGQKIKLLLVPHDVSEERISTLKNKYPSTVLYSQSEKENIGSANIMIVDKMGILSYLYRYADIAYIGGGFGKGIHNLTEAAVYGIPVLFGPNHQKFNEADELIKRSGGFSITSSPELESAVTKLFSDPTYRKKCGAAAASYILSGRGATEKIISEIAEIINRG